MVELNWHMPTGGERTAIVNGGDDHGVYYQEVYVLAPTDLDYRTKVWEAQLQRRWPGTDREPRVLWRSHGYGAMADARAAAHYHLTERIRPVEPEEPQQ